MIIKAREILLSKHTSINVGGAKPNYRNIRSVSGKASDSHLLITVDGYKYPFAVTPETRVQVVDEIVQAC